MSRSGSSRTALPALHYRGYRIPSARKAGWDYGTHAWYFVTICTHGRARCLAQVRCRKVVLTGAGEMAAACWVEIGARHPGVGLDEWVIMPDHLHGLIRPAVAGPFTAPANNRSWRTGVLGVLVNQFKRAVTIEARRRGLQWPGWQPRIHDRIVRDELAFNTIRRYIAMNPARYIAGRTRKSARDAPPRW